jgi:RNA polymerase sigma factor (sigma-70 family)
VRDGGGTFENDTARVDFAFNIKTPLPFRALTIFAKIIPVKSAPAIIMKNPRPVQRAARTLTSLAMTHANGQSETGNTQAEPRADNAVRLGELFERYRPALYSYFMRRVRQGADADDLVQDVFVRLGRLDSATEIRDAEAFIFHTAVNLLRDRARRAKAHRDAGELAALEFDPADGVPGAERVLEAKVELGRVMDVLNALGEKTRNIFILRRLEQMKVDDIAAFYGISVKAVEYHITKAQAHLAKMIKRP